MLNVYLYKERYQNLVGLQTLRLHWRTEVFNKLEQNKIPVSGYFLSELVQ